jgi:hypothetical protein
MFKIFILLVSAFSLLPFLSGEKVVYFNESFDGFNLFDSNLNKPLNLF